MRFSLSFRFPWSFHPITLGSRWNQPSWRGEHKGSKCSHYGAQETHRAITRSKARSYSSPAHPSKPLHLGWPTFHSSNISKYAKNIWVHPWIAPRVLVTCLRQSDMFYQTSNTTVFFSTTQTSRSARLHSDPKKQGVLAEQEPSWLTEIPERVWMIFSHLWPEFKLTLSTWKCEQKWAGEMPPCLKEFEAFTKDSGSVFNTHMKQLTTACSSNAKRSNTVYCPSRKPAFMCTESCMYFSTGTHTYT